jgi:hypothetical protein
MVLSETALRYANNEIPLPGDRIRNSRGGLGTVRTTWPSAGKHSEPVRIMVKWDEGIVEIDYDAASDFTLVSRALPAHS